MLTYDPARNDKGDIIGISFNSRDVTRQARQQQIAIAQQSKLNHIAYIQSHEFRRPVATIKGLIYLLEMNRLNILAEKPQALITKSDGSKELVVAGIKSQGLFRYSGKIESVIEALAKSGFDTEDLQFLDSDEGSYVIDVNRWEWKPFTDDNSAELLDLIRYRVKSIS